MHVHPSVGVCSDAARNGNNKRVFILLHFPDCQNRTTARSLAIKDGSQLKNLKSIEWWLNNKIWKFLSLRSFHSLNAVSGIWEATINRICPYNLVVNSIISHNTTCTVGLTNMGIRHLLSTSLSFQIPIFRAFPTS